jgi:ankyrin repeat protein
MIQNNGWNYLQYACYSGHLDIAVELVMKYKANVNLPNHDEWTALHLASHKGHVEIVKLLLSTPDTDINCNVNGIGTALHCACKKNHMQVVSFLLHKANFKIFDSNGNLPISLTTDKNIRKLINKFDNPKKTERKTKNKDEDKNKYSMLRIVNYLPPVPPKTTGMVDKMGKFVLYFHQRILEVDAVEGIMLRFKNQTNYPSNPQ